MTPRGDGDTVPGSQPNVPKWRIAEDPTVATGSGAAIPPDPDASGAPPTASTVWQRLQRAPNRGSASQRAWVVAVGVVMLIAVGLAVTMPVVAQRFRHSTPHVTLYTVQSGLLKSEVGGGGLTYPVRSVDIIYPVTTQVTAVKVQVGQQVQAKQVLLTLNDSVLASQLQHAQAALQSAEAYLYTLQVDGALPTNIAAAQKQVQDAQALYNSLDTLLNSPEYNHGNIIAPFSGTVTALNATSATIVNAGTTLLTLADDSTIIVKAQFPLQQRPLVQIGQNADVYPAATPDQNFTGTVTTINPTLSNPGTDTFEVWISVANTKLFLFDNESMYVRVGTSVQFPTVPELAVINPDADSIVFVYSNGRAHLRHVTVGARDGDRFGISSGLTVGDQVILVGQYQLKDGDPVIVSATHK